MKKAFLWWGVSWGMVVVFSNYRLPAGRGSIPAAAVAEWPSLTVTPTLTEVPMRSVLLDVPFTSQAPNGEWGDARHQDGCEETVAVMIHCAMSNIECLMSNGKIDQSFAKKEIEKVAAWEEKKYGSFVDTNAADTARRILGEYYDIENYQVKPVNSWMDIVRLLMQGAIVIAPMNGRKLGNPNFTAPGPERHMVLVRGYDDLTKEFVTNDPGTRKGELYKYPVDVFFKAIRDYPTGDHEPIKTVEKRMIVVAI